MSPKKVMSVKGKEKRKTVRTTIELKKEIIAKYENGVRVSDLAVEYGMAKSTISTFLKHKEMIKKANVATGVTAVTKQRPQVIEEMEKLLLIFIKEKQLAGESVSEAFICEKALHIYEELVKKSPSTSESDSFTFKASRGWFEKFRNRTGIHRVTRHGEAASSDQIAADKYVGEFDRYINEQNLIAQQVFNCDETGLFWKKMPANTYITKDETKMPGHKPMKDRLTLLLCANASGDCKIKPLLVYHSDNPRVFKRNNICKSALPVMWRSNTKSWVTRQFFTEWINEVFAPQVKAYLIEKSLPMKCLLVMDNAPAHPPGLEDDLKEEYSFIKIKFLPPNTTPILQPMDQQVISNFKKLYTKALFRKCFEVTSDTKLTLKEFWKEHFSILNSVNMIDQAWRGVTYRTLNSAWRKLWPSCVTEREFEGFQPEAGPSTATPVHVISDDTDVVEEIVVMGRSLGLEVDKDDIDELVESHSTELTVEELLHLQQQQQQDLIVEQESSEEDEVREDVPSSLISEICSKWADVQAFAEKYHPEIAVANRAVHMFNDSVMYHFRRILQRRKKQLTIDQFFTKENKAATSKPVSPPKKRQRREETPEIDLPTLSLERETTPEGELPRHIMEGDSPSKQ